MGKEKGTNDNASLPEDNTLDLEFVEKVKYEDTFDEGADRGEEDDQKIYEYLNRADAVGRAEGGSYEQVSALSAFVRQMSRFQPVKKEEQDWLFEQYNKGLEALEKLSSETFESEKEKETLGLTVKEGDKAAERLVGSMFRLSMVIARENSSERFGREKSLYLLEDLVAEANLALVEALPRYNPDRCPYFPVYAARVIRDRVRATLLKTSLHSSITMPAAWVRVARIAAYTVNDLQKTLGRAATTEETQEMLRKHCLIWARDHLTDNQKALPEKEQQKLMKAKLIKQGIWGAINHYDDIVSISRKTKSLDSPVTYDSGTSQVDLIDTATLVGGGGIDALDASMLRSDMAHALKNLTERERNIIVKRFGLDGGSPMTYATLAPMFNLSAERIRQIEAGVFQKLRSPEFSSLFEYMNGN